MNEETPNMNNKLYCKSLVEFTSYIKLQKFRKIQFSPVKLKVIP